MSGWIQAAMQQNTIEGSFFTETGKNGNGKNPKF